jgi:transcriptional regulator with XRE-family HTH domain
MDLEMMSVPELAAELGKRVQRERLRQDLTQQTLADRAGVSRPTLARLEAGGGATTLGNLLSVLVALRRAGDLEQLLAPPPATTVEQFLGQEPVRRRGRR